MKACIFLMMILVGGGVRAQHDVFDKQCSKLREITHQALHKAFADMLDVQMRTSNGYSTNGQWKFNTTRYATWVAWTGALSSTIEHYEDERDSVVIESWQYLADFGTVTDDRKAQILFTQIRGQVEGCVLPVPDSTALQLAPVLPDALPITMPSELTDAVLYTIPDENDPGREVLLMVALEKTKRGIRPMLIIEAYAEKNKYNP